MHRLTLSRSHYEVLAVIYMPKITLSKLLAHAELLQDGLIPADVDLSRYISFVLLSHIHPGEILVCLLLHGTI